jgi:hypothetical protein
MSKITSNGKLSSRKPKLLRSCSAEEEEDAAIYTAVLVV